MILATHAIVGASVAKIVSVNPIAGFIAGLLSHYFLDSIIHWDYKLKSKKSGEGDKMSEDISINKDFIFDLFKLSLDLIIGIIVIILFLYSPDSKQNMILLAGTIGGILPDFLQFLYFKIKREPLISFQKLHDLVHAEKKLDNYPKLGIFLQAVIITLFIILGRYLK